MVWCMYIKIDRKIKNVFSFKTFILKIIIKKTYHHINKQTLETNRFKKIITKKNNKFSNSHIEKTPEKITTNPQIFTKIFNRPHEG